MTQTSLDSERIKIFKSTIPQEYHNFKLETCDKLPKGLIEFGYKWLNFNYSLMLFGIHGCGKTTFAISLCHELLLKNQKDINFFPNFVSGYKLYDEMLRCMREKGFVDVEKYLNTSLLCIDDIDKVDTSKKEFYRNEVFKIINERHSNLRPTIITANCTPSEFEKNFDPSIQDRTRDKSKWRIIEFPKISLRGSIEPDLKF